MELSVIGGAVKMKRRIILLAIAVVVVFAGIALQYSCTNNNVGIDEEDATETAETTITKTPDGEEERRATTQEIEAMKEYLEQTLLDNYDVFNQIVKYLEETPGEYSFGPTDGEIVAWWFRERAYGVPYVVIDLNEIEIAEQIAYVINEFGFVSVLSESDYVHFEMVYHDKSPIGDTYSLGLICNKSNGEADAGKSFMSEITHIKDGWYRYHFTYYASSATHTP